VATRSLSSAKRLNVGEAEGVVVVEVEEETNVARGIGYSTDNMERGEEVVNEKEDGKEVRKRKKEKPNRK